MPEKPNLDLISMVQKARMMHDAEAKPSDIAAVYWIEAKCEDCPPPTSRSGQWVLDTTADKVDDLWAKVKAATVAGKLGYKSRVSTASRSGKSSESRSICVRTYDSTDKADVERIRAALDQLGLEGEWRYEAG